MLSSGPVYAKRQHQRKVNAAMNVEILMSLKPMETNTVAPEWGCNPFWSNSIVFNEICIASIIVGLTLKLGVNGPWAEIILWFRTVQSNFYEYSFHEILIRKLIS